MTDQELANSIMNLCLTIVRKYKDPHVGGPGYQQAVRHIEESLELIAKQISTVDHIKDWMRAYNTLYHQK